jgi:hypothetical protein
MKLFVDVNIRTEELLNFSYPGYMLLFLTGGSASNNKTEIEKITFFSDEVISDEDIIYFADSVFIVRAENEKLLKRMAKVSPTNWDRIIGVTISYEGEKVEDIVKTIEKLVC